MPHIEHTIPSAGGGGGAPTGAAGGSLTGTYPNPTIASIPSGATATTQAATDSSTKVASTAYVMAKEHAFALGKGGAIAQTDTNAADFPLVVPFDCTLLRMKVSMKVGPAGTMSVQLRKASTVTTAPTYSDVGGFVAPFSANNVLAVVDPSDVNLSEGDFINFTCTTGSGSNLTVVCVVIHR